MPRNTSLFIQLTFEHKKYLAFPAYIRQKIRSASLRSDGTFCYDMSRFGDSATIKVAFLNDEVVGWAVHFLRFGYPNIYMYVKKAYRRQGVGSRLINDMLKAFPTSTVHPHDKVSRAFFKAVH